MALIKSFPVQWLYYHYFIRKPIVWAILVGTVIWAFGITLQTGVFPIWTLIPLALMGLAVVLAYKMHQEKAFNAENADRKIIIRGMARAIVEINNLEPTPENINKVLPEAGRQFASVRKSE